MPIDRQTSEIHSDSFHFCAYYQVLLCLQTLDSDTTSSQTVIFGLNRPRNNRSMWNGCFVACAARENRTYMFSTRCGYFSSLRSKRYIATASILTQQASSLLLLAATIKHLFHVKQVFYWLCGQGESNSRLNLGKVSLYHLTMAASAIAVILS